MLLKKKNAVIYGAGGAVGGAVARTFAREGAKVFLAGRKLVSIDTVAKEIASDGGVVEIAQVDALDENAVNSTLTLWRKRWIASMYSSTPLDLTVAKARRSLN